MKMKKEDRIGLNNVLEANMGYWVKKYAGAYIPIVRLSNGKRILFPSCKTEMEAADAAKEHAFLIARREVIK